MARRSTGGVVIDTRRKSPVFALRFRAYGRRQYLTLGSEADGWTRAKAEEELRRELMKSSSGYGSHLNPNQRPSHTRPTRTRTRRFTSSRRGGFISRREAGERPRERRTGGRSLITCCRSSGAIADHR
jgi:hypothetical protein